MNRRNLKRNRSLLVARKKVKLASFSMQRNLYALRRMIPGCAEVDEEALFQKSIEHILMLKLQLGILKSLLKFYES
ncbi:uncharacterized protein LOC110664433 [Hevea brasiliensis]|uniref:uncharacterized protein LOC110664433 n=1 Tax=Hevea brasiliensis TaxID=3981 RepID=UPI0025F01932|nr:uncharacterized protein LOC110664433 [Hevea brasiliensis]